MHEFHAWLGLADSTDESDDARVASAVAEVREFLGGVEWPSAQVDLRMVNGVYFVSATGYVNRRRMEGDQLDALVELVARLLPGSWGMIYERDDAMPDPPGPNAFRVRVLARGQITEHLDPFLSPCNPTIED
jgi:hypothetical protein